MDFSTHDICLVYENKTFIDIKDLYSKLKNNFFLKLWYEDYLEIYSIYNKKTTDELNEKVFNSILNSHIVLVCLTKSFLAIERFYEQLKFIIKNDKLCIILILEKIDVNEVFKDLLRKDNLKLNKFEVIDFNSNFNSTYEKWSGATFNVLLNRVNEYLIESSGFISLK
jgi:hypothetical protein